MSLLNNLHGMKLFYPLAALFFISIASFSQTKNTFEIRGVLPWHNFLSGPSVWNEQDYEKYLDQCAKQGINFIGFHNYTGGGERYATYVEPMIRISYKNIVPFACFDNSTTARWGYLPREVKDFAFETAEKFKLPQKAVAYGSDCSILSITPEEHYNRSQALMRKVQQMARKRGIQMAMGFEFGVVPPEYFSLNGFYWPGEANMVPDPTKETAIALHYAAIDNILETYPGIEYIWLWLNEHCFMGVDTKRVLSNGSFSAYYKEHVSLFGEASDDKSKFIGVWALKYLELTENYLKKKAPEVKIILGGWGGGNQLPILMKGLDRGLSKDIIFSCLNPGLGSGSQVAFLADIAKNRKVWAIPWLEGDHQLWHLQPRVNVMKEHVQLAAQQNLNGILAIHWRTEEVKWNWLAFCHFAQHPESTKNTEDLYKQYIEESFGKNAVGSLLKDLVSWDSEQLNGTDGLSPEYFMFNTNWGVLNEKALACRKKILSTIHSLLPQTQNIMQKNEFEWFKNTIEFELLLHEVNLAMQPAAKLKMDFIELDKKPTAQELEMARNAFASAPVEKMFKTYAAKARSRGELGILSSLNQKLWTTYLELQEFLRD